MTTKKNILILGFSEIKRDQRILRQIHFLKDSYHLTVLGHGAYEDVNFLSVRGNDKSLLSKGIGALQLLTRQYDTYYWQQPRVQDSLQKAASVPFDLIVANDIDTLPLALHLSKGKPVIFDAHEYFPSEFDNSFTWRLFYKKYKTALCHRHLKQTSQMMTVSQGIAEEYKKRFGVAPIVVTNACRRFDLQPRKTAEKGIEIVYHGGADPSRQVEQVINLMKLLDPRFTLHLILQPIASHPDYYKKMVAMAKQLPNIRLHEPVPVENIVPFIHQFDLGLHLLPPTSFNNQHALPNRFAEFIQARLAIAVGPSAEMGRIVKEAGCGVVSDDFSIAAMARKLNALTASAIDAFKQQTAILADSYCAEHNQHLVLDLVRQA